MRLILISGDGHGAGKTFLAKKLAENDDQIFSIANVIRGKLRTQYPAYDWYNKNPQMKLATIVQETGLSIHAMLDSLGRKQKEKEPLFWAKQLSEMIEYSKQKKTLHTAVVDDLRFVDELSFLRSTFPTELVTHLHVANSTALPEPNYQNAKLREMADFLIAAPKHWGQ